MGKSKEQIQQWKEYRLSLLEEKGKSDDDFEKYITFIASGSLGLTLTFIDKISPLKESIFIWVIVLGWFSLAATLFVNLLSHYISSANNTKAIQDIDDDLNYEELVDNIDKRNKFVSRLNIISIISLGFGITCILIFTTINAYHG
tara:strand:+ start:5828 stop:6262 length:435 start_codon:yes stop_codon:yes gene_type:complete